MAYINGNKVLFSPIVNITNGGGSTEVSTEAEMTALLGTAEVGSVYKYVGATGTYENGGLYIVEAVSE
jgi:hypothetical protein